VPSTTCDGRTWLTTFVVIINNYNLETVTYCRMQFNFDLPSTIFKKEVMFLLENIGCAITFFVHW